MCTVYFENIQCGLVNVYHYLLTGRKKKKKSSEVHKLPKKRIEFSPLPSSTPVLGGSFDKDSGQPADAIYL